MKTTAKPKRDPADDARVLLALREEIEVLAGKEKIIKERLKGHLLASGEEDAKGNIHADFDGVHIELRRRVSRKLNEQEAFRILDEKGLRSQAVTLVEVVDMNKIEELALSDKLLGSDVAKMVDTKTDYGVYASRKD